MHPHLRLIASAGLALSAALFVVSSSAARHLESPAGDVILTVSGAVEAKGADGVARFDLAGLRALGAREITTSSIWTDGDRTFTGVSLDVFLRHVGATGVTLRAAAANDYMVNIPVSDAVADGPIIAYEIDGEVMGLRDKGPLWMIYPYDAKAEYRTEVIFLRSIWQLDRIEVVN
jgi:hypothetical protein